MRYFIRFSYVGTAYHGWQKQPSALTVQAVLEESLSKLLGGEILVVGAGRTDAGVHAKEMYAHFDWDGIGNVSQLVYRLNAFLPQDIAVQNIFLVPQEAHARFHAISRTYNYCVTGKKDPFCKDGAYYVHYPLDMEAMNRAAKLLLGQQDFQCFSKSNTDVRTYVCTVTTARWTKKGDMAVFEITADRFLRNMVRAIVGTLLDIGKHKKNMEGLVEIIKSGDRSKAGASVPAKGLYLTGISYPQTIYLHG